MELDIPSVRDFGAAVDFGKTAADYSKHRAGFPPRFFAELEARGLMASGGRALDLGTGAGTVARGLALAGMDVDGVDPAEALMAEAARLDSEAGVAVRYHVGPAEDLSFEDAGFDLVTAGQCWHWFDRPRAAAEAHRVVKRGGVLAIAHFDWLPLAGNVVAATEALILKYNPDWAMGGGSGFYPGWAADLAEAGFQGIESFSFDVAQPYRPEDWRGRIRASAGVKASLDDAATARFAPKYAQGF